MLGWNRRVIRQWMSEIIQCGIIGHARRRHRRRRSLLRVKIILNGAHKAPILPSLRSAHEEPCYSQCVFAAC